MTLAQAIKTGSHRVHAPIQIIKGDLLQRGYGEQKKACYHRSLTSRLSFQTAKCHNCHKVGHLKKACTGRRTAKDVM